MQISSGIFLRKQTAQFSDITKKALQLFSDFSAAQVQQNIQDVQAFVNLQNKINVYSQVGVFSQDEYTISGDIRLYNFTELAQKVNIALPDNAFHNHQLVLQFILKFGFDAVNEINGDFAFAIYNNKTKQVFVARDHMGQKPLFYHISDEVFTFSTHINGVFFHENISQSLNEKWLLNYFQKSISSNTETIYAQINKIPPGHYALVTTEKFEVKCYWKLEKSKPKHTVKTLPEAIHKFHEILADAVKSRLHNSTKIGCEFSGGLDSSGIGGMAQQLLTPESVFLTAYTNVLDEESKNKYNDFTDEWDKAYAIAQHNGIRNHQTVNAAALPPEELIDFELKALGYPTTMGFSSLQLGIYLKSKQNGDEILMSGFGGDELVTEIASSRYPFDLIKNKKFKKLWQHNHQKSKNKLKSLASSIYQIFNYNIGKEKKFARNLGAQRWPMVPIKEEWATRFGLKEKYINNHFFPPNQTLRERSLYRVYLPATTERLETCYAMANYLGLNYTYPLWDVPLMEFYYHLPDVWKANPVFSRYFYRMAMKPYFPDHLLNQVKPRNTATIPFVKPLHENNTDEMAEKCANIQNEIIKKYIDFNKLETIKISDKSNPFVYNTYRSLLVLDHFLKSQAL